MLFYRQVDIIGSITMMRNLSVCSLIFVLLSEEQNYMSWLANASGSVFDFLKENEL